VSTKTGSVNGAISGRIGSVDVLEGMGINDHREHGNVGHLHLCGHVESLT